MISLVWVRALRENMKAGSVEFVVEDVGTAEYVGRWWKERKQRVLRQLDRHEREKVVSQTKKYEILSMQYFQGTAWTLRVRG